MLIGLFLALAQTPGGTPQDPGVQAGAASVPRASERSALGSMEAELQGLYRALRPSLVQVRVPLPPGKSSPAGSVLVCGVVLDRGDLVVAPALADNEASGLAVRRYDGFEFPAQTVATSEKYGLTLLHAPGLGLSPPSVNCSDDLQPGSVTVSLGNSFGLTGTLQVGFLTGRNRRVGPVADLLQITNPLNPGDGGGLLADRHAHLIGILLTSLREAARQGSDPRALGGMNRAEGVSFAVPIEAVIEEFQGHLHRRPHRPRWLGILVEDRMPPGQRKALGLPDGMGLLVGDVLEGSPALRAGIKKQDVMIEADGLPLVDHSCLGHVLAHCRPTLAVVVLRGKERKNLLIRFPENKEAGLSHPAAPRKDPKPKKDPR